MQCKTPPRSKQKGFSKGKKLSKSKLVEICLSVECSGANQQAHGSWADARVGVISWQHATESLLAPILTFYLFQTPSFSPQLISSCGVLNCKAMQENIKLWNSFTGFPALSHPILRRAVQLRCWCVRCLSGQFIQPPILSTSHHYFTDNAFSFVLSI